MCKSVRITGCNNMHLATFAATVLSLSLRRVIHVFEDPGPGVGSVISSGASLVSENSAGRVQLVSKSLAGCGVLCARCLRNIAAGRHEVVKTGVNTAMHQGVHLLPGSAFAPTP
jgi:hypothetical protein